ncbi:glutathione S-transferase N-terminal domain-containing protein [Sorangium sp. So ce1153]|uniref:glutathione S-transferase N-terminal domain-containing protein n=1 Tax=Sorangium sp. So ce1153 TaxID=3133333 RepID=UPI003F5E4946
MKLETWLRIAGIPYETAPLDLAAAPKGKVPYIEEAGVRIGDSTLIIDHLQRTHQPCAGSPRDRDRASAQSRSSGSSSTNPLARNPSSARRRPPGQAG